MSWVQDKRDSFCKLILQKEPVQHPRIPPEFLGLYRHELPDTVILEGPSNNKWLAKLCKGIDYVYIQDDGWRNFHRDNTLGNDEFLIFQYDGKNFFKVQVFDRTGVERLNVAGAKSIGTNNPSGRRPRGRPRKHHVGSRNLSLSKSPNSRGKHNPELEKDKPEIIRVEESLSNSREEEMDLPDVGMSSEHGKHENKNKKRLVKAGKLAPHFPACKAKVLDIDFPLPADKKKMKNACRKIPDFFKVYRPEHSSQRMRIPGGFLARLDRPLSEEILLRRRTGRQWRVKVILEAHHAYFEDGWQQFVRDNAVEMNDFMVFSYQSYGVFRVILCGHSACEKKECALPELVGEGGEVREHDGDDDKDYKEEEEEEEEEEHEGTRKRSKKEGNVGERKAADEDPIDVKRYINAKNPYFMTMTRTLRTANLYIPNTVLNDYKLKLPRAVEFQVPNGRTWGGRVKVWKDGRTWISGWGALCRHNNIKKNDRCICELLEEKRVTGCIIKVHIVRGDSTSKP